MVEEYLQQCIWHAQCHAAFLEYQDHICQTPRILHCCFVLADRIAHLQTVKSKQHNSADPSRRTTPRFPRTAHTTSRQFSTLAHHNDGSLRSLNSIPASNRTACLSLARNDTDQLGHLHDHSGLIPHHQFCQNGEPAEHTWLRNTLVR
jgi:hypothetical protein